MVTATMQSFIIPIQYNYYKYVRSSTGLRQWLYIIYFWPTVSASFE